MILAFVPYCNTIYSQCAILLMPIQPFYEAARAGVLGVECVYLKGFGLEMQKERAVSRKWRTRLRGLVKGSLLVGGTVLLNETFTPWAPAAPWIETDRSSGAGSFCFLATPAGLRYNLRLGDKKKIKKGGVIAEEFHSRNQAPLFFSFPAPPPIFSVGSAMGKEQELLEAARTGNLAAVEKLLSGKRQSAGTGSGSSGTGGSGNSGGHGASSHPLSSLLR